MYARRPRSIVRRRALRASLRPPPSFLGLLAPTLEGVVIARRPRGQSCGDAPFGPCSASPGAPPSFFGLLAPTLEGAAIACRRRSIVRRRALRASLRPPPSFLGLLAPTLEGVAIARR